MKNLLIYISKSGSFDNPQAGVINDAAPLVKVQIDNSLSLGWKPKDIMLVTNFEYQYGKIKATVLKDLGFFDKKPQSNKINAILKLFENKTIKKGVLYWFHDLDAFQLQPITAREIKMGKANMALTDYGRLPRWSTGSIFFNYGARDIFRHIKNIVHKQVVDEEKALDFLTAKNKGIGKRVIKINKSYNFTAPNLKSCYKLALKPIRVVHFHPIHPTNFFGDRNPIDFFKGKNPINKPLLTRNLLRVFAYHRIV